MGMIRRKPTKPDSTLPLHQITEEQSKNVEDKNSYWSISSNWVSLFKFIVFFTIDILSLKDFYTEGDYWFFGCSLFFMTVPFGAMIARIVRSCFSGILPRLWDELTALNQIYSWKSTPQLLLKLYITFNEKSHFKGISPIFYTIFTNFNH